MAEVKGKAAGVALMSSLSYSFCSVSMVMSNKASVCLCALCLSRVLVAPAAPRLARSPFRPRSFFCSFGGFSLWFVEKFV